MKELTHLEITRGKILSPETVTLLLSEISILTENLTNIAFNADPIERETAILAYVEMQAKRSALMQLVQDSADTYRELSELENPGRN